MRAFIILSVCIALVRADVGGYNYGGVNGNAVSGNAVSGNAVSGNAVSGNAVSGNAVSGNTYSGSQDYSAVNGNVDAAHVGPAEVEKEFFTYTAPEAEFNDGDALKDLSDSLKKSLRVIFIKGPEQNGLSDAAINLAKSAGGDKTAIYILTKQADLSDLANQLSSANNQNRNKPEVHFVKYRTNEDADKAQRTIQGQYDGLGGHSQQINGGVAPVLNFASKPAAAPSPAYIPPPAAQPSQPSQPGVGYLPTNFKV